MEVKRIVLKKETSDNCCIQYDLKTEGLNRSKCYAYTFKVPSVTNEYLRETSA